MPPRRGDPPPGPSPGPQDAFPPNLIFPTLLAAAVKIQPSFADFDESVLRRTFLNMWAARPPPPADIQAATSILFAAARRMARLAEAENDPFETTAKASPSASSRGPSPAGSLAPASAPNITFPHISPSDVPPKTPLPIVPPSVKSLLSALLSKDSDDLRALDDESMSLLWDVANKLFRILRSTKSPAAGSLPSSRPGSVPAHTVPTSPVAVQPADPVTKPASPPPRPPRSPTRPPPRASRPPSARVAAPKQSYAKAAASAPAAPAAAPPAPKAPAPVSKTAALRKSCVRQGTKATKVVVRFPDPSKQPTVNQLWGTLATFKPTDIARTLRGDFILTFSQVLDSDDHAILAKKLKKVYAVDIQVLNR
ncbi:hypothetical protein AX14_011419, partial [Amanita brunnescens Koide BX004]